MVSAVKLVDAWIPNLIEPGSMLLMSTCSDGRQQGNGLCALLHCPFCARLVVMTEEQLSDDGVISCGACDCPAHLLNLDEQALLDDDMPN